MIYQVCGIYSENIVNVCNLHTIICNYINAQLVLQGYSDIGLELLDCDDINTFWDSAIKSGRLSDGLRLLYYENVVNTNTNSTYYKAYKLCASEIIYTAKSEFINIGNELLIRELYNYGGIIEGNIIEKEIKIYSNFGRNETSYILSNNRGIILNNVSIPYTIVEYGLDIAIFICNIEDNRMYNRFSNKALLIRYRYQQDKVIRISVAISEDIILYSVTMYNSKEQLQKALILGGN